MIMCKISQRNIKKLVMFCGKIQLLDSYYGRISKVKKKYFSLEGHGVKIARQNTPRQLTKRPSTSSNSPYGPGNQLTKRPSTSSNSPYVPGITAFTVFIIECPFFYTVL